MRQRRAAIQGIAWELPATELTNAALAEELPDWDAEKILAKTGIATRRIAAAGECASDLGVEAARRLFEKGVCRPEEIDFLVFCTQTADYFLPATACTMQARLGLPTGCGAVDVNQGCSGFVYALALAKGLVEAGMAARVLLITADTYSKIINDRDRSARSIFGDGAAAVVVGGVEADAECIGPFVFGTDGTGAENLIVPAGGFRRRPAADTAIARVDEAGSWRSAEQLYMNGPEIFNFTLKTVPVAVARLLARANAAPESVDYFVFHQANRFMLERLRDKLQIPAAKFCIDLQDCGNTVSSTIPIALERAVARGDVRPGQRIMILGFGVGYSWAGALLSLPAVDGW